MKINAAFQSHTLKVSVTYLIKVVTRYFGRLVFGRKIILASPKDKGKYMA